MSDTAWENSRRMADGKDKDSLAVIFEHAGPSNCWFRYDTVTGLILCWDTRKGSGNQWGFVQLRLYSGIPQIKEHWNADTEDDAVRETLKESFKEYDKLMIARAARSRFSS